MHPPTSLHQSEANARQPGGTHYKSEFQHWDFVAVMGLGYFEAQITKYIVRHRKKNGLLDVEKAEHFLQKLLELEAVGMVNQSNFEPRFAKEPLSRRTRYDGATAAFQDFIFAQKPPLQPAEHEVVFLATFWQTAAHIRRALDLVAEIKAEYAAADAARAYNAQSLDPPARQPPTLTAEQVSAADDVANHHVQIAAMLKSVTDECERGHKVVHGGITHRCPTGEPYVVFAAGLIPEGAAYVAYPTAKAACDAFVQAYREYEESRKKLTLFWRRHPTLEHHADTNTWRFYARLVLSQEQEDAPC